MTAESRWRTRRRRRDDVWTTTKQRRQDGRSNDGSNRRQKGDDDVRTMTSGARRQYGGDDDHMTVTTAQWRRRQQDRHQGKWWRQQQDHQDRTVTTTAPGPSTSGRWRRCATARRWRQQDRDGRTTTMTTLGPSRQDGGDENDNRFVTAGQWRRRQRDRDVKMPSPNATSSVQDCHQQAWKADSSVQDGVLRNIHLLELCEQLDELSPVFYAKPNRPPYDQSQPAARLASSNGLKRLTMFDVTFWQVHYQTSGWTAINNDELAK